jgi:hypothetical protein
MSKFRTELTTVWPPQAYAAGPAGRREQPILDLIETQTTRDHVDDDGVYIVPPPGPGWRVLDAHRERHTVWTRYRPVARVLKRRSA